MSTDQQKATDEQAQDEATDDTDTIAAEHRLAQASGEVFEGEPGEER
ncbi:hypothetical protein [Haloarcula nitratireducens]|uniref:Uncharacterized protein n=1 Tax=Haloarcula nitratireducens TaxID=2487749 RepID=A0AAW4PG95_9EURY|nr:hypothetical protein [Halomicroarcula nitratireducens]MBX0296903.1 hypothetical protein [Halomicroarcula nitratireducens]